ncbi:MULTISPECIES: hypothetical protein [Thermodesulfobacterium]|jgi:hypothetical protein|uniref:Uncharacterized protein n=2 Tax=Thermodesulfobacterium commune TaxID=1741 RepID=A0A075WTE7_9BACT|nr:MULTISPECIES: hypothetical protein [Thermodesulfobacterium]KUJ97946.1 MAG: Uncharacterized protein XD42_0389 [Thermodesulfobacterium sp. 37_54]KUK19683.1 MAG: Uncharacterized protein XD55_0269 [Thermodesulfobacterium commune]AIH04121.1 hypothetical protein HL41_04720 [Thermodesulfobacterium commune DSM 2178]KUK38227.1 MAG: Uncharacterized protein XD67_0506 [Thermodesulfobacterium commune]MBZ4682279.1 hypothetical protein [Thermodesulfobacterium sp.]
MKFYTLEWIKELFKEFVKSENSFFIEEKGVGFEPRFFFWALLHIYKKQSLPEIFKALKVDLEELETLFNRQEFDFMFLVDLLRKEFSFWFRDILLHKDFQSPDLLRIAWEFLMLEEQLRKQIQIPLLDRLKKLILDAEEIIEKGSSSETTFNERQFLRLLRFFNAVETLESSLSARLVERAKEVENKLNLGFKSDISPLSEEEKKVFYQNLMQGLKQIGGSLDGR